MKIRERSPLARIARWKLGNKSAVAMVIGQTVHLSGATSRQFLANAEWVAHEQVHLRQFRQYGFWRFLVLYLYESWRVGYYANRFEVEAREEAARCVGGGEEAVGGAGDLRSGAGEPTTSTAPAR